MIGRTKGGAEVLLTKEPIDTLRKSTDFPSLMQVKFYINCKCSIQIGHIKLDGFMKSSAFLTDVSVPIKEACGRGIGNKFHRR